MKASAPQVGDDWVLHIKTTLLVPCDQSKFHLLTINDRLQIPGEHFEWLSGGVIKLRRPMEVGDDICVWWGELSNDPKRPSQVVSWCKPPFESMKAFSDRMNAILEKRRRLNPVTGERSYEP